jgi:hypothetical protein
VHGLARRRGHDRLKRRRRGRALVGRAGQLDAGHLMREAISMPSGRTSEMQSETRGTSCTNSRCNPSCRARVSSIRKAAVSCVHVSAVRYLMREPNGVPQRS